MRFVILRLLQHNELGMFHAYRRLGKERAKQRAINFDGDVVDRVFPAAKDDDVIELDLSYETDQGVQLKRHRIKRQEKNWRLEGNCPKDEFYNFVDPGCLFAMVVDAGSKPATGAWAVFPNDDKVATAILSHAESSNLTAHSMIALYGSEGGYTLDLLCESKPELFGSQGSGSVLEHVEVKPAANGSVFLPPDPRRLVRILASVGHSLPSAVADIVDNAISADATEIEITFREPDQGRGRWMAITDNGRGMNDEQLAEAMRIGSAMEYEASDLGKYGYGLKGASWSQAETFSVVTRQVGRSPHHLSWVAENMSNWEASRDGLQPWMKKEVKLGDQGTCVFWIDMRPPKNVAVFHGVDPYTAEVRDLERHLGLVFHRFIEGEAKGRKPVVIKINGVPVEPNNPVGHRLTSAYDKKPIKVPTAKEDAYVNVQAFLLPSESEIKELHGDDAETIRKDLDRIGMYGRRNESQGVYVYRNDRLIQWGGWHQMWATSDEKTKLARVVVDFGSVLDDQFSVNISKQKVTLPQQLQTHIKKIAEEPRKDSRKKYLADRPTKKKSRKPGSKTGAAGTGAEPAGGSGTTTTGSTKPSGGGSATGSGAGQKAPVRTVRDADFSWKISKNMTGTEEVQVSESEADLRDLFDALRDDAEAIKHLTGFLKRLDRAGVQEILAKGTKR
jgi:hypothetical protein